MTIVSRRSRTAGVTITTFAGTGAPDAANDTPGPATQCALANPNGLFVRADGTVDIVDLDHARIRKVDTSGTMTTLFSVVGNIAIGRGLWVEGGDGAETVYFFSGNDAVDRPRRRQVFDVLTSALTGSSCVVLRLIEHRGIVLASHDAARERHLYEVAGFRICLVAGDADHVAIHDRGDAS